MAILSESHVFADLTIKFFHFDLKLSLEIIDMFLIFEDLFAKLVSLIQQNLVFALQFLVVAIIAITSQVIFYLVCKVLIQVFCHF